MIVGEGHQNATRKNATRKRVAPAGRGYVGCIHVRGLIDAVRKEVPVMVNAIIDATAAADTRAVDCQPAVGAFLLGHVGAAHKRPSGSLVFARPRAAQGAGASGHGRMTAVTERPPGQPSVRNPYLNQARSAAAFGGAVGPHPARDPV
jgi:hypothetical protein